MPLGAFPDLRYEVEDEIAEGDKVVVRWKASGTHHGDLMGVSPTGRRITLAGIHSCASRAAKWSSTGANRTAWAS